MPPIKRFFEKIKIKKSYKNIWSRKKYLYFCIAFENKRGTHHKSLKGATQQKTDKRSKNIDSVAQQVEHIPFKDGVLGSNPSWVTKREQTLSFCFLAHFHQLISERVVNRQSALATPNRAERESKRTIHHIIR